MATAEAVAAAARGVAQAAAGVELQGEGLSWYHPRDHPGLGGPWQGLLGKVRGLELLQQQAHMSNRAMMGSSEYDSGVTAGIMTDAGLARQLIDTTVYEAVVK